MENPKLPFASPYSYSLVSMGEVLQTFMEQLWAQQTPGSLSQPHLAPKAIA